MHDRLSYLRGDGDAMVLEGAIDERANLAKLVELARDGILVLDLEGVTFINSLGVRAWCQFLQLARSIGVRVELHRVSERMVHQLNIVPAARAPVTSFFAPYSCHRCGDERHVLLDVATHGAALVQGRAPAHECASCRGGRLEFDELPELYFAFLAG